MILLYHKIDAEAKTQWWVTANTFYRQLVQLSGKRFVYLDDYDPEDENQVVITFDGVYTDVLQYAAPILEKFGYPFELFITEDYIGKGNDFDTVEPDSQFADISQLKQLVEMGGRLQWHTKTHRKIKAIPDSELKREIILPKKFRKIDKNGFKWFAYAHGEFDERSKQIVGEEYVGGLACENGTYADKTIWPRQIVTENTNFKAPKVSVIIPCYNYAHFLVEAIESVLRQTYLPDEIILSDDASTDHTAVIMRAYEKSYPGLIKVNLNKDNMGIEKHFRKLVDLAEGDYICFLGADNRMQSNYIESCFSVLNKSPDVAIAYTDFLLFGNRAEIKSKDFNKYFRVHKHEYGAFEVEFPGFKGRKYDTNIYDGRNFIHGSSMYKKQAYLEVGGYDSRDGGHEDRQLFSKILEKSWKSQKATGTVLEYRQHSTEQANQQFAYFSELTFLRTEAQKWGKTEAKLMAELKSSKEAELRLRKSLNQITSSRYWRLRKYYVFVANIIKLPVRLWRKLKKFMRQGNQ